ncbi:MAG TPA: calcium-binding protein, partial [Capillimicrobium sp.]
IALLTALGALALPGAAHATITAKRAPDGAVTISGTTSVPTTLGIAGSTGTTRIAGGPVQPGPGCFTVGAAVECGDDEPRRFDVLLSSSTGKVTVDYSAATLGDAPAWITSGAGHDDLEATGNAHVIFQGGPGQDILTGGEGDDVFFAEGAPDGADLINGRGDRLGVDPGSHGDRVSYGFRSTPVIVTLPDESFASPVGSYGAAGEGDKLARIESVDGGAGGDLLLGNARGNRLTGAGGGDMIDGGAGDDRVDARRGLFDGVGPDTDIALSCGSGEDVLRRDLGDPAKDCEHDAPGLNGVAVTGELVVGSTVAATADAFGDAGVPSYQWMSCVAGETDCEKIPGATGPTLLIAPALEGRHLRVGFTLAPKGYPGPTEFAQSPGRGPVGAAAPVPAAETPVPTVVPTPVPTPPAKPFADVAAELAVAGLGAGARYAPRLRVGAARVFTAPAVSGGVLHLSRKGRAVVAGVVCPAACAAKVELSVRAGARTIKLPTARKALAARQLGSFSVALTPAQRRAVRRASQPKLTLRVSVGGVAATQRFGLRVAR